MLRLLSITFTGLFVFLATANFNKPPGKGTNQLQVSIRPVFGGQPMVLKQQFYLTANGDSVYIDAFRFYISDICLLSGSNIVIKDTGYHLVDAKDPASLAIQLPGLKDVAFTGISFDVGVDSLSNVSGAMGGDLDPAKGMYWAWNSGYVNAKLEGRSSACHTLHHAFEFHIGGYAAPYNAKRKVTVVFRKPLAAAHDTIRLDADVSAWFKNVHLKTLNSVVMPSREAMQLADNYGTMFSVAE